MDIQFKTHPEICDLLGISLKSFYSVRNKNKKAISSRVGSRRKMYYNMYEFVDVMKGTTLAHKLDGLDIESLIINGKGIEDTNKIENSSSTDLNYSSEEKNIENSNSFDSPYVEDLRGRYDELKNDKNTEIKEYKETIEKLREQLDIEKGKVDKIYYFTERINQSNRDKKQLLNNILKFVNNIQIGNKSSLQEIKSILLNSDIAGDININEENFSISTNSNDQLQIADRIDKIQSDIIIEQTRQPEIDKITTEKSKLEKLNNDLNKNIKSKNLTLILILAVLVIFLLFFVYIKFF